MTSLKWEERSVVGPDAQTYVTGTFGSLLGVLMKDVTLSHKISPFNSYEGNDKKTPSVDYCSLNGLALMLNDTTVDVIGATGAKINQIGISISGYDEENPSGGSLWIERARQGWACNLGAYYDDNSNRYQWFLTIMISRTYFENIIEYYLSNRINSIDILMRFDLFTRKIDQYDSGIRKRYFLHCEDGKEKFPSGAKGFLDHIQVIERTLPLHTYGLAGDGEDAKKAESAEIEGQTSKVALLERELVDLRKTVDALGRRPWWR